MEDPQTTKDPQTIYEHPHHVGEDFLYASKECNHGLSFDPKAIDCLQIYTTRGLNINTKIALDAVEAVNLYHLLHRHLSELYTLIEKEQRMKEIKIIRTRS